ncbi:MAG: CvpA family protein [Peptococcaceae bacterium]
MIFNFVDFAIIILLLLGALNGYRKGFIGSLVGFIGSIAALLLSVKFYKPFAGLLNEKFGILSGIHGFLTNNIPLPVEVSTVPINEWGLEALMLKVNSMFLPDFIKNQIIEQIRSYAQIAGQLGLTNAGELLTYIVAITLLNGLALILLWFIIDKAFIIIAGIFSKSLDKTFLGGVNRVGGLVVGISLNILGLMVFFGVFSLFLEVTSQAQSSMLVAIAKTVNQSALVPYFKEGYSIVLSKVINLI